MKWESERHLFDKFRLWLPIQGFTIHPEPFKEWDMVIVDTEDRRCGIQGKLNENVTAIAQCDEGMKKGNVAACAVLLPSISVGVRRLCESLKIGTIIPLVDEDENGFVRFEMKLPKAMKEPPPTRYAKPLPMTPSCLPAGVPSPRSIKDGEFMLEVLMEARGGYLTNKDFQRVGWPERFHPNWLYKLKGRPRWEPTLTAVLPSQLDPNAYAAMKRKLEAKGLANV